MLARTLGYGLSGVSGFAVKVEVYAATGMPAEASVSTACRRALGLLARGSMAWARPLSGCSTSR